MLSYIRYIHRISPRSTDCEGPFTEFPASLEAGRDFIKAKTGLSVPLAGARAVDAETLVRLQGVRGWVYFPKDKPGNWWSVAIIQVNSLEELPECLRKS